ncbi:putative oxidoreductase [Thermosporothrix hazakensis]|jgi:putative oxidoreductase|uniref:DoxX family protein n=2 Tax=Thermosporothrix TaxID=768650 RepID=A0A455SSR9_9CHLR|nr:DoxX family protein [Thermosporothrix hazakensis]PZW36727.1 putative oxidoreductase [Thermosporothrix hazakensis]BBH89195.1 hypothetical protein KTC_39460 [Thermosporothrix sp. COM3]GCE47377.1 hypothetical protein KTH_22460 [Thermosporothrix hazakensis]
MSIETGLFLLRVCFGLIIAAHGAQKLLGWFSGSGLKGTAQLLQKLGFKPAGFWALLGAGGEFGGGLLLVLGLLTPLAAAGVFAAMLMAVLKFHWSAGFWGTKGGYEYPLILGIISIILGLVGPGAYALDGALGLATVLPELTVFLVAAVLAIIVDVIGLVTSKQPAEAATQQA